MLSTALLLTATLALGPAPGDCLDDPSAPVRARLLVEVNRDRAAVGLAPLRFDPLLCRVAQERALALAAAGSPEPRWSSVAGLSRRLLGLGYQAHRWQEQALLGNGDLLAYWRGERGEGYRQAALGDFQELGIGVARSGAGEDRVLWSFLFTLPKREYFLRQTAPLADLEAVRTAVLARVNRERREGGGAPLAADRLLDQAAQAYAEEMLARAFYDHRSPEGETAWERVRGAGYRARRVGENIAKGIFSPAEVVERWLGSQEHRRNILSPAFHQMGVGLAFGENERGFEVLWVQLFATPR